MTMADFPAIGAVDEHPLVEAPLREQDETAFSWARRTEHYENLKHVRVFVRLMERPVVRDWSHRYASLAARQEKRVQEGNSVAFFEPEYLATTSSIHREVIAGDPEKRIPPSVTRIVGLSVGGLDLSTVSDPAVLADRLEGVDLLGVVAHLVRRVQSPTPKQRDLSGSSSATGPGSS